ncbi:hypothetical protein I317_04603 [Kwoniella heveanensis CBS 569]|nr:hypothetical protein I317_04603 [Kwoniella heveanensis CBS 569]
MDSDHKHEHVHSPQGPEDASNIADEYPSPEREAPPTLQGHQDDLEQQQQQQDEQDEQDLHLDEREEMDMQTEFANQVAAQAIEAAVAAEARASADAHANDGDQEGAGNAGTSPTSTHQHTELPQQGNLASQHGGHPDHMQSHTIRSQHHPRQPTFPRARSTLSYPNPSPSHSASHTQTQLQHVRGGSTPTELPQQEQIAILRESYAKNPNPGKRELEALAERTGRPWNKIREYFRQRRNKLRGLEDLEDMKEPGRASGWLQVAYRSAAPNIHVTQLSIYNSYKHRFDPYSITSPLLGGQELIQLACATFPGCEMAKDEGDYVLKGLKEKEKEPEHDPEHDNEKEVEEWEKGMEGLVEPLRAGSWLLSSFQHQSDPDAPSTLTQTELYTSYAARFSTLLTNAGGSSAQDHGQNSSSSKHTSDESQPTAEEVRAARDQAAELKAFEDAGLGGSGAPDDHEPQNGGAQQTNPQREQDGQDGNMNSAVEDDQSLAQLDLLPDQNHNGQQVPLSPDESSPAPHAGNDASGSAPTTSTSAIPAHIARRENRLLNPFELINLTKMTFPKCEPCVDASGRFIIRGLTRREGHEPGAKSREREMFPFALMNEARPGDAFVGLMKRKLEMLNPEPSPEAPTLSRAHGHGEGRESSVGTTDLGAEVGGSNKRARRNDAGVGANLGNGSGNADADQELTDEDRALVEGLKRFRGSKLGEQVRDACVSQ